ncbi:hypothetical protein [Novosphingobium sp.]|uniref:hypothetical protein n=1 Tax=Novosphingobium sp. TaxID=1874826 RepID=UPI0025E6D8EE|nr:hypothetical protein [Novosphingobium sp.]
MSPTHSDPRSAMAASANRAAQILALASPPDLRGLSLAVLHLVMARRLIVLCDRAGRDPVCELALRLRSCAAATALVELSASIDRAWPDAFVTGRPCCMTMTPDEATLAVMARTGLVGDRVGFSRTIAGFVRADRHPPLYDATIGALAAVSAALQTAA